jgi:hypothetical protein
MAPATKPATATAAAPPAKPTAAAAPAVTAAAAKPPAGSTPTSVAASADKSGALPAVPPGSWRPWFSGVSDLGVLAAADCAARLAAPAAEVARLDKAQTITIASDDPQSILIEASDEQDDPDGESPAYVPPQPGPGIVPADILALALKSHALYPIVPISVTIAQWAKESGWSLHVPANSNNPFGIKCYDAAKGCASANTPEQDAQGKQRIVSQRFQAFASFDDAFTSYARLLATSRFYAKARDSSDIDGFAKGLTPYATDTDYTASLIRDYLKPYDLYKYDQCEVAALDW